MKKNKSLRLKLFHWLSCGRIFIEDEQQEKSMLGTMLGSATAASNAYNSLGSITATTGTNTPLQFAQYPTQDTYNFQLVKGQNGWILYMDGKSWICKDVQEAADNLLVAMVEKRIDK
jgi:hypothetical protein